MKIAITNAPNIDNLKFAEELAVEHKLEVITDPIPQTCQNLGYQTIYNFPIDEQISIREKIMQEHLQALKSQSGVYTYSCVEWLADWMRWAWAHTNTEKWSEILKLNHQIANQYDKVIWLQSGENKSYDGYTWLDKGHCEQINSLIPFCANQIGLTLSATEQVDLA